MKLLLLLLVVSSPGLLVLVGFSFFFFKSVVSLGFCFGKKQKLMCVHSSVSHKWKKSGVMSGSRKGWEKVNERLRDWEDIACLSALQHME